MRKAVTDRATPKTAGSGRRQWIHAQDPADGPGRGYRAAGQGPLPGRLPPGRDPAGGAAGTPDRCPSWRWRQPRPSSSPRWSTTWLSSVRQRPPPSRHQRSRPRSPRSPQLHPGSRPRANPPRGRPPPPAMRPWRISPVRPASWPSALRDLDAAGRAALGHRPHGDGSVRTRLRRGLSGRPERRVDPPWGGQRPVSDSLPPPAPPPAAPRPAPQVTPAHQPGDPALRPPYRPGLRAMSGDQGPGGARQPLSRCPAGAGP